jgi:hypothetical protein
MRTYPSWVGPTPCAACGENTVYSHTNSPDKEPRLDWHTDGQEPQMYWCCETCGEKFPMESDTDKLTKRLEALEMRVKELEEKVMR